MGISKTSTGHRSKVTTSHYANKATTAQSLHHHHPSRNEHRRRSWTKEQLSDDNYLKVPATVWKNIHDPTRTDWMDAAEDTLTPALAAGALLSSPSVGLARVYKWFWDKSIETKTRKDTYRYRVIEDATDVTILPEDEWFDPLEDDENKIKILFIGLPFKDHTILLLRRICPDVNMDPMRTDDEWRQYLAPSIRQGFAQIKRSTTYGWPLRVIRKKGRKSHVATAAAASRPSKKVGH